MQLPPTKSLVVEPTVICYCGKPATTRIDGRNYCDDHKSRGYSSTLFAANAGD